MSAGEPPIQDGEPWTTAEKLPSNGAAANAWSESARRLVVLGYITAVAIPMFGFVLGIVLTIRPAKAHSKHGAGILVVSVIASAVWIFVITSGALKVTTNDVSS